MKNKSRNKIMKILSALLSFIMLISVFAPVNIMTANAAALKSKIDFSDSAVTAMVLRDANTTYSTEQAYGGASGSLKLKVPVAAKDVSTKMFSFSSNGYITDWSKVDYIRFNIYSQSANSERINVVFSKTSSTINNGYWFYTINVNWSGWKTIDLPLSSFAPSRGITSWNSIDGMYFNLGGWNAVSKASTVLYISSIEAVSYSQTIEETLLDSYAVYAGEKKAIGRKSETMLSVSPEYIYETVYAPLSLFSELLKFTSTADSVSKGDLKITFTDSSSVAKVGAYDYKLSNPAHIIEGKMYVPLNDVCTLFDIPYQADGRLAVFGSADDIEALNAYESFGLNLLTEQMAYKIAPSASNDADSEDCEKVIQNWLKVIVGNETINASNDSAIKNRINSLNNAASGAQKLLIKEEGSSELFEGITTLASADMTTTALRIYQMAAGYGTYGASLYKNESLKADILYALEWFYENRYGDDEAANNENAWRNRSLFNWHDWRIGTPKHLITTLMIMRNDLSSDQIAKYLECFEAVAPAASSTGNNFIEVCRLIIGAAALKGNTERIKEFVKLSEKSYYYVDDGRNPENHLDAARSAYTPTRGQGFYKDGSYVFHTLHSMNGTYGLGNLGTGSDFLSLFEGTAFEMSKFCSDNVADWIVNSFDAIIYKNKMPRMFLGRGDNPNEISQPRSVVSAAIKCFDSFDEDDKKRIGSIIKELASHSENAFISSVPISSVQTLKSILASSDYDAYDYSNSNILANIDKAMHKRPDWAVGISMSSSRIFNYECINNQNLTGWYLGDGRTELYLEDEGVNSESSYWANIDYYRLPGTTVDTQERKAVSIAQGNEYLSSKDFVGGVELDEEYITAAMHLESYHNDTDFGKNSGDYGGPAPAHTSDLTAKKSYFAFDDEIFCLGAEVNAKANNNADVLTVVDNRFINARGYSMLEVTYDGQNRDSTRFSLAEHGVKTDWSKAKKVVIPVYSTVANNDYLNIQLCKGVEVLQDGYIHNQIKLDWTGWKNIEIAIDSNSKWKTINSVHFNIGGWNPPTPTQATTKLYFGDITVVNADGSILATVDFTKSFTAGKANMDFTTEPMYDAADYTTPCSLLSVKSEGLKNVESKKFDLSANGIATNWSGAKKIVIPIYSAAANSDYVNLVFCVSSSALSAGYVQKKIQLNWSGWKNVEVAIDSNSKWKTINAVYFNIGGWGSPTPMVSTKIYFGDVKVINSDGSVCATIPYGTEKIASLSGMEFKNLTVYPNMEQQITSDIGTINLSDTDQSFGNLTWINLDDHMGYYFPGDYTQNPGELKVRYKDNNFRYFEAIFDHGVNPTDSSYAYALLPNMTSYETAEYANNSPVEILSNTGSVQAVRHNELGITSIVFWEAGSFEGITVSEPLIVMLKEGATETTLAVSDPTQKLTGATVTIDRIMHLANPGSRITQSAYGTNSSFAFDFTETLGATLQAKLKHTDPVVLDLVLTDTDGNAYNRYLAHKENTVKAKISLKNLSDTSVNARYVIAMYSADGKLHDVHTTTKTVLKGRTVEMPEVILNPKSDTALIKGFVWEKGSLKPFDTVYINN